MPAGDARKLVFVPGYGRSPDDYGDLLDLLERDLAAAIVSPFVFGNPRCRPRPTTFLQGVARLERLVQDRLGEADDWVLVGHSTGASAALLLGGLRPPPRALVALNPAVTMRRLPAALSRFGWLELLSRSIWMNLRHSVGASGSAARGWALHARTGGRSLANAVSNELFTLAGSRFLNDLRRLDLEGVLAARARELTEEQRRVPIRVVRTAVDEFFGGCDDPRLDMFEDAEVRRSPERSHEWMLIHPRRAADEVTSILRELGWPRAT